MTSGTELVVAKAGEEAAIEVAEGLASILSIPSQEAGNYIADKVRFLRFKSLLKIMKKAEKLCKESDTKLNSPAIKFLVPFAEAASLEEENDDNIQSLWAKLLKNSSDLDIGDSLLFVHILKNIGGREVAVLDDLIKGGRADTNAMFISYANAEDSRFLNEDSLKILIERLPEDFEFEFLADLVVSVGECTGIKFLEVVLLGDDDSDFDEISSNFDPKTRYANESAISVLEALGVLSRFDFKGVLVDTPFGEANLYVQGYRVTPAGVAFYHACSQTGFKHKFAHDVNDDQTAGFGRWLEARRALSGQSVRSEN